MSQKFELYQLFCYEFSILSISHEYNVTVVLIYYAQHANDRFHVLRTQYSKLISGKLCSKSSSISAFFGASLLRLSVNTCDAELYRCSLATDVSGADCQTSSVSQRARHWVQMVVFTPPVTRCCILAAADWSYTQKYVTYCCKFDVQWAASVSYTHLTLPTIYSV